MEILFSHNIMDFSNREDFVLSGSKFFPLSEVTLLKRNAIKETTAHFSWLPLMCVNSLVFWLRPCLG